MISILQNRKLRHRKVKQLAQGEIAGKGRGRIQVQGGLAAECPAPLPAVYLQVWHTVSPPSYVYISGPAWLFINLAYINAYSMVA